MVAARATELKPHRISHFSIGFSFNINIRWTTAGRAPNIPPRCPSIGGTLTPFLYPFLLSYGAKRLSASRPLLNSLRCQNQSTTTIHIESSQPPFEEGSHLNPPPSDYSHSVFTDKAIITLHSGAVFTTITQYIVFIVLLRYNTPKPVL
jgi:hypothetical protein